MKYFLLAILIVFTFYGCSNAKKAEADLNKEVLNVHEKVMADDEKAMLLKMKLDTVIRKADTLKTDKSAAVNLNKKLVDADNQMSDWMKNFNPDNTGKNHDDVMKYLHTQLNEVKKIDSVLLAGINESSTYLKRKH